MTDTSKEEIAEILDAPERLWASRYDGGDWRYADCTETGCSDAIEYIRDDIHAEAIEALKSKVKALREENYQLWRARLRSETPTIDTLFGVELGEVLDMVIAQQEQQT